MTYLIHLKVDLARVMQGLLKALVVTIIAVGIAAAMVIWCISFENRLNEVSNLMSILRSNKFLEVGLTVHVAWFTTVECMRVRLDRWLLDFEAKGQVFLNGT